MRNPNHIDEEQNATVSESALQMRGAMHEETRRPSVLVTGFSRFPRTPENPTEPLVRTLSCMSWDALGISALHASVLAVRHDGAREAVMRLIRQVKPDIAVHFGLAVTARGFRLERMALNLSRR